MLTPSRRGQLRDRRIPTRDYVIPPFDPRLKDDDTERPTTEAGRATAGACRARQADRAVRA